MSKSIVKAKVLMSFYFKDGKKNKDGKPEAYKVGEICELTEEQFDDLEAKGFVVREVIDQSKEVERLTAENKSLKKQVAELKAIIEKAAGKPDKAGKADKTEKVETPPKKTK